MSMKESRLWLIVLCVAVSCITPLDQDPSGFEPYLVVEGFITDDFGPHEFNITEVTAFTGVTTGGAIIPIEAVVEIVDQDGVRTPIERPNAIRKDLFNALPEGCVPATNFVEVLGPYQTPASFRGEIGNTYTLEVRTRGKIYRSTPQTIVPTPPIDSVIVQFKELPSTDDIVKPSGLEVLAVFQDPPDERNYYSWEIDGIYRINTPDRPLVCCLFDPADGGEEVCWIVEDDIKNNEIAFSDESTNGNLNTVIVGFIEDDGLRFASNLLPDDKKYYIEVAQYQMDEAAFEFYNNVKTLAEIDGEIFDPLPLSIRGNVFNEANPDEIVIGHFSAFSVQKKGVFVPESTFEFKQVFPNLCGDCRVRAGAQIQTPAPFQ